MTTSPWAHPGVLVVDDNPLKIMIAEAVLLAEQFTLQTAIAMPRDGVKGIRR